MLTIGSLFSGIGGLELGLQWSGLGPVRWQVEIDPFARGILAMHWPHARRYRDVREVGAATLPWVDVVCGGFPCQDVSQAGKGAGLGGARSGLWSEFARVVRELRPWCVLVENVAALGSEYGTSNNGCPGDGREAFAQRGKASLSTHARQQGGILNPDWVEALMGYPPGWTDGPLDPETLQLFGNPPEP